VNVNSVNHKPGPRRSSTCGGGGWQYDTVREGSHTELSSTGQLKPRPATAGHSPTERFPVHHVRWNRFNTGDRRRRVLTQDLVRGGADPVGVSRGDRRLRGLPWCPTLTADRPEGKDRAEMSSAFSHQARNTFHCCRC
jgi:hypothetical protein